MRSSVIVFVFVAIAAGGRPCLALSIPSAPQMNFGRRHQWATDDVGSPTRRRRATAPRRRRRPILQMSTTTASPIGRRVVALARRRAA